MSLVSLVSPSHSRLRGSLGSSRESEEKSKGTSRRERERFGQDLSSLSLWSNFSSSSSSSCEVVTFFCFGGSFSSTREEGRSGSKRRKEGGRERGGKKVGESVFSHDEQMVTEYYLSLYNNLNFISSLFHTSLSFPLFLPLSLSLFSSLLFLSKLEQRSEPRKTTENNQTPSPQKGQKRPNLGLGL